MTLKYVAMHGEEEYAFIFPDGSEALISFSEPHQMQIKVDECIKLDII